MTAVAAPPGPLTPDDLLRVPENGVSFELVDGRLKELPVSLESGRAGARLIRFLDEFCDRTGAGWVYPMDVGFTCFPTANTVRKPDVAVVAVARMPTATYTDRGYCPLAPDLVAEVVSPNDVAYDVVDKIAAWLAAGVRAVWEVYPHVRLVRGHRPGAVDLFGPADVLTAPDVLPGFAVPVAALFRRPGDPPAAG